MHPTIPTTDITLSHEELQTLRTMFSYPQHRVDATAACSLATTLAQSTDPVYQRIAVALEVLHGDALLSTWFQALHYELFLREFLLDDLCKLFYGISHFDLIRSDLREISQFVKIFRYKAINCFLINKFKSFKSGSGPFPYPPKNWLTS